MVCQRKDLREDHLGRTPASHFITLGRLHPPRLDGLARAVLHRVLTVNMHVHSSLFKFLQLLQPPLHNLFHVQGLSGSFVPLFWKIQRHHGIIKRETFVQLQSILTVKLQFRPLLSHCLRQLRQEIPQVPDVDVLLLQLPASCSSLSKQCLISLSTSCRLPRTIASKVPSVHRQAEWDLQNVKATSTILTSASCNAQLGRVCSSPALTMHPQHGRSSPVNVCQKLGSLLLFGEIPLLSSTPSS